MKKMKNFIIFILKEQNKLHTKWYKLPRKKGSKMKPEILLEIYCSLDIVINYPSLYI